MSNQALESAGVLLQHGRIVGSTEADTYVTIAEVTDIDGPGGDAAVIPVTHLESTAIEKLIGLPDEGSVDLSLNLSSPDSTTDGQALLRSDRTARNKRQYRIMLTDSAATAIKFNAFVRSWRISHATDEKVAGTASLEVDGAATYAAST